MTGVSVLPPTRVYTADEVTHYLAQDAIDGVLVVTLAGDQAQANYLETITSSRLPTAAPQAAPPR